MGLIRNLDTTFFVEGDFRVLLDFRVVFCSDADNPRFFIAIYSPIAEYSCIASYSEVYFLERYKNLRFNFLRTYI